ncbi:hypothetical protein [Paraburkholderia atlantica]|uniref:hypothetical protein n=1 Tax=Paraburkholderia atlantica TaxID=2654982 RepID=UPI0012FF46E1|nr:hypothetical protein [Paraburkholderia atlantica]
MTVFGSLKGATTLTGLYSNTLPVPKRTGANAVLGHGHRREMQSGRFVGSKFVSAISVVSVTTAPHADTSGDSKFLPDSYAAIAPDAKDGSALKKLSHCPRD